MHDRLLIDRRQLVRMLDAIADLEAATAPGVRWHQGMELQRDAVDLK